MSFSLKLRATDYAPATLLEKEWQISSRKFFRNFKESYLAELMCQRSVVDFAFN